MEKIKQFAVREPFIFGMLFLLLYAILAFLSYPAHFFFPATEIGMLYGDVLSRALIVLVLLLLLWRMGWVKASGITRFGNGRLWLVVAVILVYKVLVELFAYTGDIALSLPNTERDLVTTLYLLPGSMIEELIARGLVLVAMVLAWGDTKQGQVKVVIFSALVFGLLHLVNLVNTPVLQVLLQVMVTTMTGVLYAALVLHGRTLWPAIIIHWLTNAAINVKILPLVNYEETAVMALTFALGLLPLVAYSAYLVWKLPVPYRYPMQSTAVQDEHRPSLASR